VLGEGVARVVSPCCASLGSSDARLCSLLCFSSGVSVTNALYFWANIVEAYLEDRMCCLISSMSV